METSLATPLVKKIPVPLSPFDGVALFFRKRFPVMEVEAPTPVALKLMPMALFSMMLSVQVYPAPADPKR